MRYDEPHNANRPQWHQTPWHQLNIQFDHHQLAESAVIAHLGPVLMGAESTGLVISWFFIRKQWWRFRYLPTSDRSAGEATKLLADTARSMRNSGYASLWVQGVYEPETHAFGGAEGMAVAHILFHADSRHIVEYLRSLGDSTLTSAPNGQGKRRELSVLLCAALMRAAGQDRYEQGDIWAKVVDHRPTGNSAQPAQWRTLTAAMKRLITVDTGPETALRTDGALESVTGWLTAFEQLGKRSRPCQTKDCSPGESAPSPPTTSSSTGIGSASLTTRKQTWRGPRKKSSSTTYRPVDQLCRRPAEDLLVQRSRSVHTTTWQPR